MTGTFWHQVQFGVEGSTDSFHSLIPQVFCLQYYSCCDRVVEPFSRPNKLVPRTRAKPQQRRTRVQFLPNRGIPSQSAAAEKCPARITQCNQSTPMPVHIAEVDKQSISKKSTILSTRHMIKWTAAGEQKGLGDPSTNSNG